MTYVLTAANELKSANVTTDLILIKRELANSLEEQYDLSLAHSFYESGVQ